MTRFSIIIPALNEAVTINGLISHLRGLQQAAKAEIIIVDGSDDGDTAGAVNHESVRCINSQRGRAIQMNTGAQIAQGDILIFLHADTRLPQDALILIDRAIGQDGVVGGAFDLAIQSNRKSLKIIGKVASRRSRMTRIPYGDQAIFIRRDYFRNLGGYPEVPLMEDVALMRIIKRRGDRIHIIPRCVGTSPRRWEKEGILYTTIRNWTLISLYFLGIPPETLAGYYRSGKHVYGAGKK
jgi:rSAM/selenodomain-associated transferase 2